jgi:hypothetical protein
MELEDLGNLLGILQPRLYGRPLPAGDGLDITRVLLQYVDIG